MDSLQAALTGNLGFFPARATLTRTIIEYDTNALTSFSPVQLSIGIVKVTNQAFAAGSGSMPDPQTDEDADWLFHVNLTLIGAGYESAAGTFLGWPRHFSWDLRSQRKVDMSRDTVALLAKPTGGINLQVGFGIDTFYKL